MNKDRNDATMTRVGSLPMVEEATPAPAPAPMPRQELVFWTPRLALTAMLRAVTELRRPQRAVRRATIPVSNADEPR
jgi:hypothetical protein